MGQTYATINKMDDAVSNEVSFAIEGDYIVRYTPLAEYHGYCKKDIVMDKKTFVEAFENWIYCDSRYR